MIFTRTGFGKLLAALAAVAVLTACGGPAEKKAPAPETISGVKTAKAELQQVADEIEAPGVVRSAATAQVAARVMGTITEVAVREGDAVRRGQMLVRLDEQELQARLSAADAALESARAGREEAARGLAAAEAQDQVAAKTYGRYQFLREQKSVSAQEFDEIEARQRAAQAARAAAEARGRQAEAMLARAESEASAAKTVAAYARVVAPFDGVVVRRTAEPGAMASPGDVLLTLEDTSRYRLEATLEARSAAAVRRGSAARVRLDAVPEREFTGTVVELEAGADAASQTVRARIELPRDAAIRSGLFGRAWFARGTRKVLAVPRSAVIERGQLRALYVVDAAGLARLRFITLGVDIGGLVEVLSGLAEGERIVLEAQGRELDGRVVAAGEAGR